MAKKIDTMISLIRKFENTDFQDKSLREKIQSTANRIVDWDLVENYYKSMSIEELAEILISKPVIDAENLSYDDVRYMVSNILQNITHTEIVNVGINALQKRFPRIEVSNLFFYADLNNVDSIVSALEKSENLSDEDLFAFRKQTFAKYVWEKNVEKTFKAR